MQDREMLELAAKAAGKSGLYRNDTISPSGFYCYPNDSIWNPLTDDGDALRLAVKLKIDYLFYINTQPDLTALYENDPHTATRRAIVCAAAAIGKMKGEKES